MDLSSSVNPVICLTLSGIMVPKHMPVSNVFIPPVGFYILSKLQGRLSVDIQTKKMIIHFIQNVAILNVQVVIFYLSYTTFFLSFE